MTPDNRPSAYERISSYVSLRTGLALPPNRRPFIEAGLARAIASARLETIDDYAELLEKSNRVPDELIAEITVGETYFFRDPDHFDFIRREIIPELRRRQGRHWALRAWSAGCASGEEPYSLAILFEEEQIIDASHILATDISRAALAKAQAGIYGEWSLRKSRPGLVEHYFRRRDGRFVLADRIRRGVTFAHLNLAADDYLGDLAGAGRMDLILCRNVLIYIEPNRIAAVAERLHAALADGGWLITGPSDPLLSSHAPFDVEVTPAGVFYRRAAPRAIEVAALRVEIESTPDVALDAAPDAAPVTPLPVDPLALAREAFKKGDYATVTHLLHECRSEVEADELRILSLANLGLAKEAERAAADAAAAEPLVADRHILHAITLLSLRRYEDAIAATRRAIYLKSSLALAHHILGTILRCVGANAEATQAFRNSRALAAAPPAAAQSTLLEATDAARP
jgi:chemotaxis protein methyltransferase CheR